MAKAASAGGAAALLGSLPEEIVVWEILVRLPPKSLLHCRSVCRAWRHATSTRDFLLTHHGRQPSLPVISGYEYGGIRYKIIHTFDHRATDAQLQPLARLDDSYPEASCDGLLILSKCVVTSTYFSVCNPATLQHAPLPQLLGFGLLAMYRHRPTGEYRLLVHQNHPTYLPLQESIGCYILVLGSDLPPRYIGSLDVPTSVRLHTPALLRDSLHWYPAHYLSQTGSKLVIVFDNTSESFRQMRAPVVPARSYIFEMDTTLGIYSHNEVRGIVDIWVLHNYEDEVWNHEHHVELSIAEIKGRVGRLAHNWVFSVVSVGGDVLLVVSLDGWMFYFDVDGQLVDNFHRDDQSFYACRFRLKQSLVPHTFFTTLERYAVNAPPSI